MNEASFYQKWIILITKWENHSETNNNNKLEEQEKNRKRNRWKYLPKINKAHVHACIINRVFWETSPPTKKRYDDLVPDHHAQITWQNVRNTKHTHLNTY